MNLEINKVSTSSWNCIDELAFWLIGRGWLEVVLCWFYPTVFEAFLEKYWSKLPGLSQSKQTGVWVCRLSIRNV